MNLNESDEYKVKIEKNLRHRRGVAYSIGLCAVLVGLLIVLIYVIQYQDSVTMKYFVNDRQVASLEGVIKDLSQKSGEHDYYFDIQSIEQLVYGDQHYKQGEYKKYNENIDSCYIENPCEIIAITAEKNYYTKYTQITSDVTIAGFPITSKTNNGYSEDFFIEKPVKLIDNRLYVSMDDVGTMFNIQINWDNPYRFKLYTMDVIVESAKPIVARAGYQNLSGYFENLKAILDGYAIVSDPQNPELFGVLSLSTGTEILGTKYKDIRYVQNLKEFYLTAENGTMGLADSTGTPFIPVQSNYTSISILDEQKRLYLVGKDRQYGVVDKKGQEIIFVEYDQLGIDISKFEYDDLTNGNLLFEKCIPFFKKEADKTTITNINSKDNTNIKGTYGLLDLDGNVIPDISCDSFGYISLNSSSNSTRDRSTLIIPESMGIKGIIYNRGDRYGIYIVDGNENTPNIPASFAKIYVAIKDGQKDYYLETIDNQTIRLADYLADNGYVKKQTSVQPAPTTSNEPTNTAIENTVETITEEPVSSQEIKNEVGTEPAMEEGVSNEVVTDSIEENVESNEIIEENNIVE